MMIKKFLILCALFLFSISIAFAYYDEKVLNDLEYTMYGKVYANDSLSNRLIRLETDSFGMAQVGDIDTRLARLYHISNNPQNQNRMSVVRPSNIIYPNQKPNKIRSILNNVASVFASGMMTGYTPPFDSYNYQNNMYNPMGPYPNNYQSYCPYDNYDNFNSINSPINNNYYSPNGYQNTYISPHGYNDINKNYGYGSRIRILRD